jgi:hypothetical protein
MDRIDHLAEGVVRRGCGFALLAIFTVMWGLSYDLLLSLETGAILVTLCGAVLAVFAYQAPRQNHKSTELWVLLDKGEDLPPHYPPAQLLEVMRKTYIRYAELSGKLALGLCAGAAFVWLVRG